MEADRELMLEDARSIREGLWRMARYAQDAAEALDSRIEDETLDGRAEAVEGSRSLGKLADPQSRGERGAGRLPAAVRPPVNVASSWPTSTQGRLRQFDNSRPKNRRVSNCQQ